MKSEIKITREKFLHLLLSGVLFKGSSFVGIDSLVVESLEGGKKNPMLGRVTKQRIGALCLMFTNENSNAYQNMVNKRLAEEGKEPNFVPGKRQWGTRMDGMPIIRHQKAGEDEIAYYIEVIEAQSAVSLAEKADSMGIVLTEQDKESMEKYVVGRKSIKKADITYFLDGVEIAKSDIEGMKQNKEEGAQGGLTEPNKVIFRNYKIESLLRISIGGKTYILEE